MLTCRVFINTVCMYVCMYMEAALLCQRQLIRSISCALLYERGVKGHLEYLLRKVAWEKLSPVGPINMLRDVRYSVTARMSQKYQKSLFSNIFVLK